MHPKFPIRRSMPLPILFRERIRRGSIGEQFSVDFPVTGDLYQTPADATHTIIVNLPTSTLPLTRVGIRYRAETKSDCWEYYYERNLNDTWDLKRAKVSAGVRTETTIATGEDELYGLRVTTSGNTHTWYTRNSTGNWNQAATTSDATHNDHVLVGSFYSGGVGSQLITNSDFTEAWVAGSPPGWTTALETGDDPGVIEHPDGARINNSLGPNFRPNLFSSTTLTPGAEHLILAEVDVLIANAGVLFDQNGGTNFIQDNNPAVGVHTYAVRKVSILNAVRHLPFEIPTEHIVHYLRAYRVGALDDGETGPVEFYSSDIENNAISQVMPFHAEAVFDTYFDGPQYSDDAGSVLADVDDDVAVLKDWSSWRNNIIQTVSLDRPTLKEDGVFFDGLNDEMVTTVAIPASNFTIVLRHDWQGTTAAGQSILNLADNTFVSITSDGTFTLGFYQGGWRRSVGVITTGDQLNIWVLHPTASTTYHNGIERPLDTKTYTPKTIAAGSKVATWVTSPRLLHSYVKHFAIIPRALSAPEIAEIVTWSESRFGPLS